MVDRVVDGRRADALVGDDLVVVFGVLGTVGVCNAATEILGFELHKAVVFVAKDGRESVVLAPGLAGSPEMRKILAAAVEDE